MGSGTSKAEPSVSRRQEDDEVENFDALYLDQKEEELGML